MVIEEFKFTIRSYNSIDELNEEDSELLAKARNITKYAYAPYSQFRVGSYARLINGQTLGGTNQENASYPAGICAERTLLSTASSLFPGIGIKAIAVSYQNVRGKSDTPISPCGICRQSIVEFQERTNTIIRLILSGMEGKVLIIENAANLLPLVFGANDMV